MSLTDDQVTLRSVAHQAAGLFALVDSLRNQVERDAVRGGRQIDPAALAQNLEKLSLSLLQLTHRARGIDGAAEQAHEASRALGLYRRLVRK